MYIILIVIACLVLYLDMRIFITLALGGFGLIWFSCILNTSLGEVAQIQKYVLLLGLAFGKFMFMSLYWSLSLLASLRLFSLTEDVITDLKNLSFPFSIR